MDREQVRPRIPDVQIADRLTGELSKRTDDLTSDDPKWQAHLISMILYERNYALVIVWKETKYYVGRLRALGFAQNGKVAKVQVALQPELAMLWQQLWNCAALAVNFVSHNLRDAYAISVGHKTVRSVKVRAAPSGSLLPSPH